jgi:hypothetical protein
LLAKYLQLTGQGEGGDHVREREQEREREVLSDATRTFGKEIQRKAGRALSFKELAKLDDMFKAGVPLAFALEEAKTWTRTEPPWTFAGRVQGEWGAVRAVLANVDSAMRTQEACYLSDADKGLVALWGTSQQRAYCGLPAERG